MPRILKRLRGWPLRALFGAALLPVGAGAILISSAYDERPTPSRAGEQPVNVGAGDPTDIRSHNSPTLARNPVRRENLAVSNRIDTPRFACALHISRNNGNSWRETRIPNPAGEERKCFAPDIGFASDGTLYVAFVTLKGAGNVPNAVWISKSKDGGRTLSRPAKALGPLSFQVRLVVDPRNPRRLYLTWLKGIDVGNLKFLRPGNPIRFTRSDDGGTRWRRPVRVNNPSRARAVTPSPALGPKGEIYVLYLDLGEDTLDYEGGHGGRGGRPYRGPFKLVLARSLDGGARWEESEVDGGIVPIDRFIVFFPPYPSIAVDPRDGRVFASFHDARLGDPDVEVWSLPPGKARWDGPVRVNDTPEQDGTSQYLPRLAVAPNGRLDVIYYDRRSDRKNVMNQVTLQSSFDEGKSFSPALRLSSRRHDSTIGFGRPEGLPDLGSRLALLSENTSTLGVWTDTRFGTGPSNKQDLFRALVVFSEPPRLSDPLEYGLRYGGLAAVVAGLLLLLSSLRPRARSHPHQGREASPA